ncbi:hypothetical protein BBC27_01945 [Acidithiobacillus ferrivorans]|uniref:Uncharacterized protein n=1 Tax=Acidithiobacillus ferrivorans TaxID=160808 RepID=A0A1B9BVY0_9PROT|nr:hypothetical protein BBC27_01945 [Acidithiobacillus ferrivorans]
MVCFKGARFADLPAQPLPFAPGAVIAEFGFHGAVPLFWTHGEQEVRRLTPASGNARMAGSPAAFV